MFIPSKVLLSYPNRVGDVTFSDPAEQWSTAFPLSNLALPLTSRPTRSFSTGSLYFTGLFGVDAESGTAREVGAYGLIRHNFGKNAQARIILYADTGMGTELYDSGNIYVWPNRIVSDAFPDFTGYASNFVFNFDDNYPAASFRVEITDADPFDSFLQIGRFFIAPAWQPEINMSYGVEIGFQNKTSIEESLDLTEYFDVKKQKRTMNFSLDALTESEGYDRVFQMYRYLGVNGECIVCYNADTPSEFYYDRSLYGRLQSVNALTHPVLNRYTNPISVLETL